jgi:hypothetical protein
MPADCSKRAAERSRKQGVLLLGRFNNEVFGYLLDASHWFGFRCGRVQAQALISGALPLAAMVPGMVGLKIDSGLRMQK